jgi:hypothetical protein
MTKFKSQYALSIIKELYPKFKILDGLEPHILSIAFKENDKC